MEKVAYLTIDDAPSSDFTAKLTFLQQQRIPAVFFCRGDLLAQQPEAAVRAVQLGYILGNHSYDHPSFSTISLAECQEQIRKTDAVLAAVYNRAGVPWQHKYFRFPYGDRGDLKLGHLLQGESARWKGSGPPSTRRWHRLAEQVRRFFPERVRQARTRGLAREAAIQHYLHALGYQFPPFLDITYSYLQAYQQEKDWPWTFDVLEWSLLQTPSWRGGHTLSSILARLEHPTPPDPRGPVPAAAYGLSFPGSAEIILLHDHAETSHAFYAVVERLLEQGIVFKACV
ncbi:polysaccharide deacetylase family protein [Hymenobacter wooponensis]|uniref:Polysaccharide deacetylase family protein n=1 Tax=Hymenobacter wooponensis TaxID=1525360 RepID=A0A4Z0MSB2_9BACT|nr:polysaccharide deacetylase family protein [Hymenobacter wooponensis]TGD82693.1 polysaccharide deacetylase family protein [Hymenobacter wooponensis]